MSLHVLFLRLLYAESVFVNALHSLLMHGFQYLAADRHSALGSEPLRGQAGRRVGKPERFLHGAAPFNVSPAPVVSTTLAFLAGTVRISPDGRHVDTPLDPWVITSLPGCALSISSTGISPNRMAASCSFGVR